MVWWSDVMHEHDRDVKSLFPSSLFLFEAVTLRRSAFGFLHDEVGVVVIAAQMRVGAAQVIGEISRGHAVGARDEGAMDFRAML